MMSNIVLHKNDKSHATDSSESVIPSELKNSFKSIQKSTSSWSFPGFNVSSDSSSASASHINRNKLIKKIKSFKNLEHGWNGYNGLPIDDAIINNSIQILKKLHYLPEVFPTGRNSIQFEFSNEKDDYLEFEIYEDKIILYKEVNGEETECEVQKDEIRNIIRKFYV